MLHWHLWLITDSTWLTQDGVCALSIDRNDNKYRVVSRCWYVPVLGTRRFVLSWLWAPTCTRNIHIIALELNLNIT